MLYQLQILRSVELCRKVTIISGDLETMKKEAIVAYFNTVSRLSSGRCEKTIKTSVRRVWPSSGIKRVCLQVIQTQSLHNCRPYTSTSGFIGHAWVSDRTLVFALRCSEKIHASNVSPYWNNECYSFKNAQSNHI
jgi:hypothetical protein